MRKIFISYRRAEAEYPAGALGRELRHYFGDEQVFRDKEDIGGGVSWRQEVLHEIGKDSAMLVLIGEDWANAKDAHGKRRLNDSNDPLRLEISDGLRDGAVIIPILLENARMPSEDELPPDLRPLGELNAMKLRDGDWRYDLDNICKELQKLGFKQLNSPSQAALQEQQATHRNSFNWSNPVVLLLLTSVISASGWAINKFIIERDRSNLRFEAQDITQAINLLSNVSPMFNGENVFCDTAKLTLLLAHNGKGKRPLLVNKIAMKVEQIKPQGNQNQVDCAVDTLSSRPFGIALLNTYVLDITSAGNSGRFIESAAPDAAHVINPDNILDIANKKQVITLKPDEEPIAYDVRVETLTGGLYRVWFSADYDAAGAQTSTTKSFIIGK
jgi:hypothetical protein